jgi:hypothetical protein
VSITNITQLILFITVNSLYFEDHTKPISTLFGQNVNILSLRKGCLIHCVVKFVQSNDLKKISADFIWGLQQ